MDSRFVVRLTNLPGKRPLFCFPTVSGFVGCYKPLANALDGKLDVYAFRTVGRLGDVPAVGTLDEAVQGYVDKLREIQSCGTYALCGWSTGGIVAFEAARCLIQHGSVVEYLGLFDTALTHKHIYPKLNRDSFITYGYWVLLCADLLGLYPEGIRSPSHPIWSLRDEDRVKWIYERIDSIGIAKVWKNRSISELNAFSKFLKHQWDILRRYYEPRPAEVAAHYVRTSQPCDEHSHLIWKSIAKRGVEMVTYDTDHDSLLLDDLWARKLAGEILGHLSNNRAARVTPVDSDITQ